jgi:hypothetical protein
LMTRTQSDLRRVVLPLRTHSPVREQPYWQHIVEPCPSPTSVEEQVAGCGRSVDKPTGGPKPPSLPQQQPSRPLPVAQCRSRPRGESTKAAGGGRWQYAPSSGPTWHGLCCFFPAGISVSDLRNANAAPAIILRWAAFPVGTPPTPVSLSYVGRASGSKRPAGAVGPRETPPAAPLIPPRSVSLGRPAMHSRSSPALAPARRPSHSLG